MKMVQVQDLFEAKYGSNLELNKQIQLPYNDPSAVPYVSRTAKNNGVTTYIQPTNAPLNPAHTLSVACGGSILSTFYQAVPYYSSRDVYFLKPKIKLSVRQMLYYKMCIEANKFRFSYGRLANRTLPFLEIPAPEEIPAWVETIELPQQYTSKPKSDEKVELPPVSEWKEFKFPELFDVQRGNGRTLRDAKNHKGNTPYIGSSEINNGITCWCDFEPTYPGKVLTIATSGSVGATFYQEQSFCSGPNIAIISLRNKEMNLPVGLFLSTCFNQQRKFYSYGRVLGIRRIQELTLTFPVTSEGQPDYDLMERYINSLPYSDCL